MAAKRGMKKFVGPEIGPLQVNLKICKRFKEDSPDEEDGMEMVLSLNGTELMSTQCGKDLFEKVGFGILANLNELGRLKT